MREKLICRRCETLHLSSSLRGHRPFVISGSTPHYAPDLPFRLEHILLDVRIDPRTRRLEGTVTQRVCTITPGQEWLVLDQVGISLQEASVRGKSVSARVDGRKVMLPIGQIPSPGETFEFSIRYSVSQPQRGLYFIGPDSDYPNKVYQAWTQGQDEDNRFWFPTFDYPNQKATSEMIATVPSGFTAVSNGALISKKEDQGWTRFHYKLGTPHVTYLITLVVGEFSEWSDSGVRGLPVQYFVPKGREADGKRAFSNTPKMIEAFERKIGVPYPYEKYSQAAVQDFIFGGMENTSATTQTDLTLHDERAHLDFTSDPLVSHELAHQWFGDLLTCRDWSHGWLNEGFATFMERVWIECHTGPHGGPDEAKYYSFQDLHEYLDEDSHRYRRPIVSNSYIEPIDLFDAHLYQKGGLVLNLIRGQLGEELFWKSVELYVTRHRGQNVETIDLIRAIEDATGRNLRRLFDQWVFGPGYPEFELSYAWDEEQKRAELVIEQKQKGEGSHAFQLFAQIELTLAEGKVLRQKIELKESRERIFFSVPTKPLMVRFDPNATIPKTLKFPRPKEMLLYQLIHDSDCMGRIEAAEELAKVADAEVISALGRAAASDSFWGVQAEVAAALGEIRTDSARDALISALSCKNPKARKAIARHLGSFRDEKALCALEKIATHDESYFVEADATVSLVQAAVAYVPPASSPLAKKGELERIEKFLIQQLEKQSYREVIRSAALKGISLLPGIGRGEHSESLRVLVDWARRGRPADARRAAVDALGRVAKVATPAERSRILEVFSQLSDEPDFRLRMALVSALRTSGFVDASAILGKIRSIDLDGRVRRECQVAIDELNSSGSQPEVYASLKASFEKLEEDHRKLKSVVEELKASSKGAIESHL